jgi:uncharacterized protein YidB (DUF937 family)
MGLLDQVIGSVLGSRTGGSVGGRGGSSPLMMALMALLASRSMGSGGLGGMLGGGLTGGTGGGFGGGLEGGLGGGLGGLLEQFTRSGHGDVMNSWIGHGENRSISPSQLEEALGPDSVDQLSQQTSMPRQDILSELSNMLPGVVDKLTPEGRLPNDDEMKHW